MKGMNWYFPFSQKCLMCLGLAYLYPTNSKIAAKVAKGILFKTNGIAKTLIKSITP
jgi:hypothetical protein